MNAWRVVTAVAMTCVLFLPSAGASVLAEPSEPPGPSLIEPAPPHGEPGRSSVEPGSLVGDRRFPGRVVPWRQFGRAESLELRGANLETRVDLAITNGLTPTSVSGQIGSAVNIAGGRVDVFDAQGTALGTIPIPLDTPAAPFVVDTTHAVIDNNLLTLSFVLRPINPPSDTCAPTPSVNLNRLATTLAGGSPNPATVADFLPAYLQRVVISTGPNPSADKQQAALALTAMITRHYRPIPVRVDVDTSGALPGADQSTTRVIAIRDSPKSGIEVINPGTPRAMLEIRGRGPDLVEQIAMFIDNRQELAQSASVAVLSADAALTPASTRMTFEQLGAAPSASFTGSTTLYLGFDGAAFAVGPIDKVKVDLRARYTPVADDKATLLIKSGSYVLATHSLDQSGTLDLSFDLPSQVLSSDIGMALDLQYFPSGGGGCAPLNDQMTFALDPQSTVEVSPGPARGGGFNSLPAGFTPEFAVAVDRPDLIRYAAQAINLIGQRTSTLLRPQVSGWDEVSGSGIPLLAVTGGEGVARFGMKPPVSIAADGNMEVEGSARTTTGLVGPLAIVQSFTDNARMVLAIDVPDRRELADETFEYIRGLDGGWSSLSGDLAATGSGGETVNLTVRSNPASGRSTPVKDRWRWSALATVGVAVVAGAALIRRLWISRRRAAK